MKRLITVALAAASVLALSACETATPYQPAFANGHQTSGGYSEQQLEQNRWGVSFAGNSLTSRERVERYLLYRSAELTLAQGYDWFTTLDRNTERKTSLIGSPDPFYAGWGGYWGPSWGLYRRGFGWGRGFGGYGGYGGFGYGGGWGSSFDVQEISRYTATAEVIMGRGPKPAGDPRAFDARSVVSHLGGVIQRPPVT